MVELRVRLQPDLADDLKKQVQGLLAVLPVLVRQIRPVESVIGVARHRVSPPQERTPGIALARSVFDARLRVAAPAAAALARSAIPENATRRCGAAVQGRRPSSR